MKRMETIRERLAPHRRALLEHRLYSQIERLASLHVFMEHHVFAVWDFMSLLKALQQRLSVTQVPWLPSADRLGCRLVNEIVLGEESDEDGEGGYASHFELYLRSMKACCANTKTIERFIGELRAESSVCQALERAEVPQAVQKFVRETFRVIDEGDLCIIAATFTFGREDLLPDVFRQIVDQLSSEGNHGLKSFKYYLERHIELDGDEHGPMAERLVATLAGDDELKWQRTEEAAVKSLESRLRLWDDVAELL